MALFKEQTLFLLDNAAIAWYMSKSNKLYAYMLVLVPVVYVKGSNKEVVSSISSKQAACGSSGEYVVASNSGSGKDVQAVVAASSWRWMRL